MKKSYLLSALTLILLLSGCGDDDAFNVQHNQGKDCLQCHSFSSGVTLYKDLHGANEDVNAVAESYSIQLALDSSQTVKYVQGNGLGNFLFNGDTNNIISFTPQVTNDKGEIINQSRAYSHDSNRLACNRCHTQEGLNGAPGRVVNYNLNF